MNPLFLPTSEQTCFWRKLTAQGASHPPGPTCSRTSLTIFPSPRLLPTPPRSVLRTKPPSPPQETRAHRAPFSEPSSRVAPQFSAKFPSATWAPARPPLPPAPPHSSDPCLPSPQGGAPADPLLSRGPHPGARASARCTASHDVSQDSPGHRDPVLRLPFSLPGGGFVPPFPQLLWGCFSFFKASKCLHSLQFHWAPGSSSL